MPDLLDPGTMPSEPSARQAEPEFLAFAGLRSGPFANPFLHRNGAPTRMAAVQFVKWLMLQPDVIQAARFLYRDKPPAANTPECDLITSLSGGYWPPMPAWPVLCFGANLAGRHGRGVADYAARLYGAQPGVGQGRTGHAYALPTRDETLAPLPIERVIDEIELFFGYARAQPETPFRLTRVGCGLAGLDERQISEAANNQTPANVELPGLWLPEDSPRPARVIIAGSRTFNDCRRLNDIMARVRERLPALEIVSGGADGADRLGEAYAVDNELPFRRFPAYWGQLGKPAGFYRNEVMAWYATHLVAFHQNNSPGTGHMISSAGAAGLKVARIGMP